MKSLLSIMCLFLFSLSGQAEKLRGKVKVDGSSTVFPITEAIAEEYREVQPRVRVQVGKSGTGGGFKKFARSQIDINDASRRIKKSEIEKTKANKIEFLELEVAFDGISVVVNKDNNWANDITTAELKKIWEPNSKVEKWSDIRESWPNEKIKLFGPGTDSGTYDYFTKVINGKSHVSRSNFTKSEDDNVLVRGVSRNKYAMAFFGFAYYKENRSKIKALKVNGVAPTELTINDGSYKPLSRPVFIYVSKSSSQRPEVYSFIKFYLKTAASIASEVGYVALPEVSYSKSLQDFEAFVK
ncbi:MAG: PstS family phosphate ABC transporter substrate-binding protein [Bdellovibrionales bacterium]